MKNVGALTITMPSDREIAITRIFDAPRRMVFDAYTKPEFLKRWLGAFGGWELVVCTVDLRVGGTYRYEWLKAEKGIRMGSSGVFREVVAPERVVVTEKFDDPWYEGECISTVTFAEDQGKTTLTMTLMYESKKVRDSVLASPMEGGLTAGFDKLAELVASPAPR